MTFTSIEMNRIVDGKASEHSVEIGLLGLLQQLGAVAAEPAPRQGDDPSKGHRCG